MSIQLNELNGNEKQAALPQPLPGKAIRPGTIRNGDVMLYGPRTLVVFYQAFKSSCSYTPLGRIHDPTDLARALGAGSVSIAFTAN